MGKEVHKKIREKLRENHVRLSFSDEEYKVITDLAEKRHSQVASFIREFLFENINKEDQD